jgi:hypothetical protein
MSQFSERFDAALQTLGFPFGSVAFDLARTPNLTDQDYYDLLENLSTQGGNQ